MRGTPPSMGTAARTLRIRNPAPPPASASSNLWLTGGTAPPIAPCRSRPGPSRSECSPSARNKRVRHRYRQSPQRPAASRIWEPGRLRPLAAFFASAVLIETPYFGGGPEAAGAVRRGWCGGLRGGRLGLRRPGSGEQSKHGDDNDGPRHLFSSPALIAESAASRALPQRAGDTGLHRRLPFPVDRIGFAVTGPGRHRRGDDVERLRAVVTELEIRPAASRRLTRSLRLSALHRIGARRVGDMPRGISRQALPHARSKPLDIGCRHRGHDGANGCRRQSDCPKLVEIGETSLNRDLSCLDRVEARTGPQSPQRARCATRRRLAGEAG